MIKKPNHQTWQQAAATGRKELSVSMATDNNAIW